MIMKIQNLIYMGILSTLVLAGCKTNDDNSTWSGSDGIVFNSYIGSHTRASGSSWGNGDEVGIYMTGAGAGIDAATAVNKKYLAQTNGILTPESKTEAIYYPETGNADFVAYYPYSSSVADNIVAVNVSNQSKPEAIDLLYSNNAKNIANGATVSLGFTHQLSLVTIDLKNTDGTIPSLNGTTVSMGGMNTQASFDLDGGVLTVSPQSAEPTLDMYMVAGQDGAMKAQAIVLPTKATGSSQTQMVLTFKLDGMTFEYTVSDISAFEGGKEYLYTADLSINNGKPTVKMGNATITDWVTVPGGDIDVDFDGGSTEPGEEKVLLDESFATGQGQFTIDDKQLPEGSTYVWKYDEKYTCMKASAFVGGAKKASESWLVSPELSLADVKSAVLSFEHAHNYAGTASEELTLWITETSAENWKQLTIDKYGEQFKFVAVSVDLASYLGKTVKFAFKYVSTTSAAATWEIKNVKVVANGDGTVDPEPEPTPAGVIFEEKMGTTEANKVKIASYTNWDNKDLQFSDETGNADVRAIAHKTEANPSETAKVNNVWLPAGKDAELTIAGINAAGHSKFKLTFEAAANVFNTGTSIDLNKIKVTFNDTSLTIPSKVVSKDNNDANVFYTLTSTFEVAGTENSILKFTASETDNTVGLRLYNIKLETVE